jgi:hypothetical protein
MKISLLITLLVTLLFLEFNGQILKDYQSKYAQDNGVFIEKKESATITLDKTGKPLISSNSFEKIFFLNDNFKYYMKKQIGYSSFYSITDILPFVYIPLPDGKFKKNKITQITDEDDFSGGIFHDDYKSKTFFYSGLEKGGLSELSYNRIYHDPHFFGSFHFSSYLPVEKASYSITVPSDMEIAFTLFGTEKEKVIFTETVKGKTKTLTWTAENLKKLESEDDALDFNYFSTHVVVRIAKYNHNNTTTRFLGDVNDLYTYYRDFVKDINLKEDADLIKLADSISKNHTTPDDKVKAIYYWVQENIKYVAFEDSLGGFVPREAKLVCDRRYGDCKDMSSLLYKMINSIGLKAYYTWIGTRDIPYTYIEVPTPKVDNHMICTYFNGTDYIFLDATGNDEFGKPTSFIQGKQALVGISETEFKLLQVPIVPAEQNAVADTVYLTIEDNLVKGKGKVTYIGYDASYLRPYIQGYDETEMKKFFENSFKKGNNKSTSSGDSIHNLKNKDLPLIMEYKFDIPEYIKINEDEVYFNAFIKKYFSGANIKLETNTLTKQNDYESVNRIVTYLKIPDNLTLDYLPKNSSYTYDKFSFTIEYTHNKTNNTIEINTYFVLNYTILEPQEFVKWNEFVKKLNQSYAEVITFKKK